MREVTILHKNIESHTVKTTFNLPVINSKPVGCGKKRNYIVSGFEGLNQIEGVESRGLTINVRGYR